MSDKVFSNRDHEVLLTALNRLLFPHGEHDENGDVIQDPGHVKMTVRCAFQYVDEVRKQIPEWEERR